jgi:glycosyltransferase involved in cell wall biosynthesis
MHGCTLACEIWQHLCDECGVKIVFTLHGLNSFSDTVRLEPAGKQYERVFLKSVTAGERKISVISTGIKKLIERTYQTPNCSSISVVCNAFSFQKPTAKIDVRKLYNIPDNSKIILYVGNVSVNKNQAQLVSSFNLLEKTLCDNTYILFVGNYKPNDDIVDAISNSKYKEHLILCGNVDKSEIGEYYRQADGVALLSISEGFGLSLIEGLHFGLPCMMFSDIDAFSDIYSPDVAVAIEVRRDTAVAAALTTLLTKPWNHDDIKTYSKKFESDEMARQYINFYKQNLWE